MTRWLYSPRDINSIILSGYKIMLNFGEELWQVPSNDNFRYILKNSMGVVTCIWHKNGLFMSMLDENNKWGSPFLLSDNATPDFSALLNSDDVISACFVDYSDRLIYITACEEPNKPIVLLESRISGSAPYDVNLVEADGLVHVFYIVNHNRRQLITYQKIDGTIYSMPEVQGVLIRDAKNYAVCSDGSSIHLFFVTNVQNVNLLVHRRISDGRVSKPVTTPFPYSPSHRLQAAVAKNGSVYVLASCEEGDANTVIFKFDPILNKFNKGLEVYNATTGQGSDSLILVNNNPFVVRSLRTAFIISMVRPDLSGISDESKVDLTGRDIPLKCKFQSNHKEDFNFKCDVTPMLFGNGLRFPFDLKTLAAIKPKEDEEENPEEIKERIRELENRIEFLENAIREILRP